MRCGDLWAKLNLLNDVVGGVRDLLVGNLDHHLVISGAGLGAAILLILMLGAAAVVEDGDLEPPKTRYLWN